MSETRLPDFDEPALARAVEALPLECVNALPFGAIRLDGANRVAFYSEAERRLSGYRERPALGLDFFRNIAPCMDIDDYHGRLQRALQAGTVDIEFSHIGDFGDRTRELRVRIQSASGGGCWIFMSRD
jgi:photoactive yellow protein